jgi:response regulator RpfG family c-di-GMP phosphodiesterase
MSDTPLQPAPLARILCVDDETSILSALKRVFRTQGFTVFTANSGQEGLAVLEKEAVDVVVSDMRMPEMDGAQFLEQVFARWPSTKRILLTGYADAAATIAAINQGKIWRYVSKPWNDAELILTVQQALAHRNLMEENARLTRLTQEQNEALKDLNAGLEQKVAERTAQLRQGFLSTVHLFSSLTEMRGGKLAGHARRVADTSRQLAERLGLSEAEQQDVLLAALLHDIGKMGLPDNLLNAPFNSLSAAGKAEVMLHPAKGQQLISGVAQLKNAATIIRHHHEYLDGSGYPDRLAGWAIPLGSRILAVANDYDALQQGMLTLRTHSPLEATQVIEKGRGHRYDPAVVDAFKAMIAEELARHAGTVSIPIEHVKPGMTLANDLIHPEGYTLLQRGNVFDADNLARLQALAQESNISLTASIVDRLASSVLKDPAPEPLRTWKELVLSSERLKPGMVLNRSLHHKDGYLLLAQGCRLDEPMIKQLREFEHSTGVSMKIYIRIEDR